MACASMAASQEDPVRTPVSYFVVSFLPAALSLPLAGLAEQLPETFCPVSPARMHLTYRSFDGLPPGKLGGLKDGLRRLASSHPVLPLLLTGLEVFPGGALWVGVQSAGISALQQEVDALLARLGLPAAGFPFVPHVTIGLGPEGCAVPVDLQAPELLGELDELTLSTTGTAEYRVVLRLPLGAG